MRKSRIAAAGVVVAALVSAGPAAANLPAGKGHGEIDATCDPGGSVTLNVVSGAAFWVGEQKYVLKEITLMNSGQSFTALMGNKNGLTGGDIHCTGSLVEEDGSITTFDGIGVSSK